MEQTYDTKKMIITLFIVLAIIAIFYGITILITKNKKEEAKNETYDTVIQYKDILVGELYNQREDDYYVLAYNSDEESQNYISSLTSYSDLELAIKTYTIDLTTAFNKKYVASESDFNNSYPIFSGPTLLRITNKQITEIYEDDDIATQIENMSK